MGTCRFKMNLTNEEFCQYTFGRSCEVFGFMETEIIPDSKLLLSMSSNNDNTGYVVYVPFEGSLQVFSYANKTFDLLFDIIEEDVNYD